MSTALIIGAGLSAWCGYATTSEILHLILERAKSGELFSSLNRDTAERHRRDVLAGLTELMPGLLGRPKLPAITSVLSLIDYLILNDEPASPALPPTAIRNIRTAIHLAVLDVLSQPANVERKRLHEPQLQAIAEWLVSSGRNAQPIPIITTNYDVAFELAVYRRLQAYKLGNREDTVDYGFSWRNQSLPGNVCHRPRLPSASIFKLHGSINWLKCSLCGYLYIAEYGNMFQYATFDVGSLVNTCYCGYSPLEYVMVAPSTVRDPRDVNLRATWQASLEALRISDNWIVLGYSLPEEDTAIRSLFIRAARGRSTPTNISIFELNPEVEHRFATLFTKVMFNSCGISAFVEQFIERRPTALTS
jgi:NAD-dependent SIR2 family protein deacetylase